MDKRYVVFDRGFATEIARINAHLTARIRNEAAGENLAVFDSLEEAKKATLVIVERYADQLRPSPGMFSTAPKDSVRDRLSQLSALTEEDIDDYYFL
jgi:hypothetical protein